jgi:hypothetical protein
MIVAEWFSKILREIVRPTLVGAMDGMFIISLLLLKVQSN